VAARALPQVAEIVLRCAILSPQIKGFRACRALQMAGAGCASWRDPLSRQGAAGAEFHISY
jgi:hypothetical protein